MPTFSLILPAAGRSTRFGAAGQKKIFAPLAEKTVWEHALIPFLDHPAIRQAIIAVDPEDRPHFDASPLAAGLDFADGGAERSDSIRNALAVIRPDCDFIAIHDAARPCVSRALINAVFEAAIRFGAAIPGVPVADTLKAADENGVIVRTIPRAGLWAVQTPQVFRRDWLERAFAHPSDHPSTDDAQLLEALSLPCQIVPGSPLNIKITHSEDLALAQAILASRR